MTATQPGRWAELTWKDWLYLVCNTLLLLVLGNFFFAWGRFLVPKEKQVFLMFTGLAFPAFALLARWREIPEITWPEWAGLALIVAGFLAILFERTCLGRP